MVLKFDELLNFLLFVIISTGPAIQLSVKILEDNKA